MIRFEYRYDYSINEENILTSQETIGLGRNCIPKESIS